MTMQERRKLLSELKQQGKSNTEIARILCITRKQVEYARETKDYRPKTICEECGEEFIPKAFKKKNLLQGRVLHKKTQATGTGISTTPSKKNPYGRIRPYTYTSNLLIADDIKKGDQSNGWQECMTETLMT